MVEEGDMLLELDSSQLVDQEKQQKITVVNAEAAFVGATENRAITRSQGESDVAKAELTLRFAELDHQKYLQGDFPQSLQEANAAITMAEEELRRANDQLDWSERLHKEGYITKTELQADDLAAKRRALDLQLAQGKLAVLQEYTHRRSLEQLRSNIIEANMALDRVKRKATGDGLQADAELTARRADRDRQKERLDKITEQLTKCTVRTPPLPDPGTAMVVHATTGRGNPWGDNPPLKEGSELRERQELIFLPTSASMMADVRIHESRVEKVKIGMPVRITVDAIAGRTLLGRVGYVAPVVDSQGSRMNPDLKVYAAQVYLEEEGAGLRAGMTCRCEIVVREYENVLHVPIQTVVREADNYYVYVLTSRGQQKRAVRVGLDNNSRIIIEEGLREGELVMQAPPLSASSAPVAGSNGAGATSKPRVFPASLPASGEAATQAASRPGRPDLRNMTPEERQKYLESLSPQEREALMQRRGSRGSREGGSRDGQGGGRGRGAEPGGGSAGPP
jgi:HlyD family secretion protein